MADTTYRFEVLQIHTGQEPAPSTHAWAVSIYQTADNIEHSAPVYTLEIRQHLQSDHESDQ